MTAQHPAAPETETDANGLTEALHRAFHDHWDSPNKPLNLYADSPLWQKQAEAVERIVAERVRVVEGERDAAVMVADSMQHFADVAEVCERKSNEWAARAESAEAAHEAEKAAHERLRAVAEDVERLARAIYEASDEYAEEAVDWENHLGSVARQSRRQARAIASALLAGGGAR